jgi:hypothetical protein
MFAFICVLDVAAQIFTGLVDRMGREEFAPEKPVCRWFSSTRWFIIRVRRIAASAWAEWLLHLLEPGGSFAASDSVLRRPG